MFLIIRDPSITFGLVHSLPLNIAEWSCGPAFRVAAPDILNEVVEHTVECMAHVRQVPSPQEVPLAGGHIVNVFPPHAF